jgi:alpha-beta hydrolase superfamily lysophospholipase
VVIPSTADLQALRDSLAALGSGQTPSEELLSWWRFYGLDLADTPSSVTYQCGTVESGAFNLAVHRWSQADARANLVLVHGYTDHSGLFRHLIEYGLRSNFNVVIFDLPGHGLSTGERAAIDSFSAYGVAINDVLQAVKLPELKTSVMAQSTGCSAVIEFARRYAWPFQRTVLLAPLLRPVGWRRLRVAHRLTNRFVDTIARKFNENSSDLDFLEFIKNDPLQPKRLPLAWVAALREWLASLPLQDLGVGPVLVVQGDRDTTVDWRYNIAHIGDLFPGSRIELLAGAGHQLANEAATLREHYLSITDEYLKS